MKKIPFFFLALFCALNFSYAQGYPDLEESDSMFHSIYDKFHELYSNEASGNSNAQTDEEEDADAEQFYRWAKFWRNRTNGSSLENSVSSANAEMFWILNNGNPCGDFEGDNPTWEKLGPFNSDNYGQSNWHNQGRVEAISVNPNNSDDILIGALNSGIWRKKSGTNEWENTTDDEGFSAVGISTIIRHPANPEIVYAATGNYLGFLGPERSYGIGVIMSDDGGDSWRTTGLFQPYDLLSNNFNGNNGAVYSLAIEPSSTLNNTKLYAGMDERLMFWQGDHFANDDNWEEITDNSTLDLSDFGPDNYFSYGDNFVNNISIDSDDVAWFTDQKELFKRYWSNNTNSYIVETVPFQIPNDVSITCGNLQNVGKRMHLDINKNDAIVLKVSYYCSNYSTPDYRSWLYNRENLESGQGFYEPNVQVCGQYGDIALSPYNDNIVYIEHGGTFDRNLIKATNFGLNPITVFNDVVPSYNDEFHADVRCIYIPEGSPQDLSGDDDIVYVGDDGGIGKVITNINGNYVLESLNGEGLLLTNYIGLGITNQDSEYICTGAQDGSINFYHKGNWKHASPGADNGTCAIHPKDKTTVYQTQQFKFFKTTTAIDPIDETVDVIYNNEEIGGLSFYFPMLLNPNAPNEVFISDDREVYLYTYDEITNTGSPSIILDDSYFAYKQINSFGMSENNNNILYVSWGNYWEDHCKSPSINYQKGGILRAERNSTTGTWNAVDITNTLREETNGSPAFFCNGCGMGNTVCGLPGIITDIAVDPDNVDNVWITMGNFTKQGSTFFKVFNTKNANAANPSDVVWTNETGCLPNVPCITIAYQRGTDDRVYVGTDIGVFVKEDSNSDWKFYGKSGPKVYVSNLEINYCSNELVASTEGQGLWRVPLLMDEKEETVIETTTTWRNWHSLDHHLRIKDGAVLIVEDATILAATDVNIIIEKGGRLIATNSIFTNRCGDRWDGFVIEGDANLPQSTGSSLQQVQQGLLSLTDCIIEHANTAVKVYKTDPLTGVADPLGTGGVVVAYNTIFKDNLRDVDFYSYRNLVSPTQERANFSDFRDCTFTTTDEFLFVGDLPGYWITHASLIGVRGINFYRCRFMDERDFTTAEPGGYTTGISSLDANCSVDGGSLPCEFQDAQLDCIGTDETSSLFRNLNAAITVGNFFSDAAVDIRRTLFEDNAAGITSFDMNGVSFIENTFFVGNNNFIPTNTRPFVGIQIWGGTDYQVTENNVFRSTTLTNPDLVEGIVAIDTGGPEGSEPNQIYRNHFRGLDCSLLSNGDNRGDGEEDDNFSGLNFRCNDMDNNAFDIAIIDDFENDGAGIAVYQAQGTPENPVPSGNFFTGTSVNIQGHIFNDTDNSNTYYYPTNGGSNQNPVNISDNIVKQSSDANFGCESEIIVNDTPNDPLPDDDLPHGFFEECEDLVRTLKETYKEALDGGDTEELIKEIQLTPLALSGETYEKLMELSPWLSKPTLDEVVAKSGEWEETKIRNVLVANPDVIRKYNATDWLANLNTPLSTTSIETVVNATSNLTERSNIELQIALAEECRVKMANQIIRYFNTIDLDLEDSQDSVRYWLNKIGTFPNKIRVTNSFKGQNNTIEATANLNSLSTGNLSELQKQDVKNYKKILTLTADAGTDFVPRKFVASNMTTLADIAVQSNTSSGIRTNGLFNFVRGGNTFFPSIKLPDNGSTMGLIIQEENSTVLPEHLTIVPNPFQDATTINYEVELVENCTEISITDFSGKQVKTFSLTKNKGSVEWQTESLPKGIYYCSLICEGRIIRTEKAILLK